MSDINYCDAEAGDDPRFAYTEDTFAPPPGVWAPDCGHAACIEDDKRHPNWHDWDCPVAECRWNAAREACQTGAGHEGDHSYALPQATALHGAERGVSQKPRDITAVPPCPVFGSARVHDCQLPLPPVVIDVKIGKKP